MHRGIARTEKSGLIDCPIVDSPLNAKKTLPQPLTYANLRLSICWHTGGYHILETVTQSPNTSLRFLFSQGRAAIWAWLWFSPGHRCCPWGMWLFQRRMEHGGNCLMDVIDDLLAADSVHCVWWTSCGKSCAAVTWAERANTKQKKWECMIVYGGLQEGSSGRFVGEYNFRWELKWSRIISWESVKN